MIVPKWQSRNVDSFQSLSHLQSWRKVSSVEKEISSYDCYLANWPGAAQSTKVTNVNYNMKTQATHGASF